MKVKLLVEVIEVFYYILINTTDLLIEHLYSA